jgi:hypothetical protein
MQRHKSESNNIKKVPYWLNTFKIIPHIFLIKLLSWFLAKPLCLKLVKLGRRESIHVLHQFFVFYTVQNYLMNSSTSCSNLSVHTLVKNSRKHNYILWFADILDVERMTVQYEW